VGKRRKQREVTPTEDSTEANPGEADESQADEAELACPQCGATLVVHREDVGESGQCPDCGAIVEVPADTFGEDDGNEVEGLAQRVARLVGDSSSADSDAAIGGPREEPGVDALLDAFGEGEPEPAGKQEQADDALLADLLAAESPARGDEAATEPAGAKEESAVEPMSAPEPEPAPSRPAQVRGQMRPIDYLIWQGVVGLGGDWAMAARLDALRRAEEAGCETTFSLPNGTTLPIPEMVITEAAVAAFQTITEAEWRSAWTGRLLKIAAKWDDDATREAVVAILAHADSVIAGLKAAGVWPWDAVEQARPDAESGS
jgi:hypothetical protein